MQVTSYGGKLRYTIEFTPGFDSTPNSDHDVEISVSCCPSVQLIHTQLSEQLVTTKSFGCCDRYQMRCLNNEKKIIKHGLGQVAKYDIVKLVPSCDDVRNSKDSRMAQHGISILQNGVHISAL